jgi:neopullulanase
MIKKLQTILLIFFITSFSFPQSPSINKIEPPDWWIGMKWNKLQLMIYGEELSGISVTSKIKELLWIKSITLKIQIMLLWIYHSTGFNTR